VNKDLRLSSQHHLFEFFAPFFIEITFTMTTQRVFRLPQRTSIHDLQVSNEEVPSPTSQEVLIRIKSVALNFRDFAVSTGKYPFPVKDNVVPGSDLSGEVVSIGDRVEGFSKGDKVIASFDLNTL
jgi:NADPH:quinone reductase-like Zn-dependent oxidoreductase